MCTRTPVVRTKHKDYCVALVRVFIVVFSDRDGVDRLDQLGAESVFQADFLKRLLQRVRFSAYFVVQNEWLRICLHVYIF